MRDQPVPLTRHFSILPQPKTASNKQEKHSFLRGRNRAAWQELEQEFRCVILAEAGAGKSFEMKARARHLEEQGRSAFLIRIEDIEDGFETAFEVGSAAAFKAWMNSIEEAWFFLDSVDEARLEYPRTFEKAIRRFAERTQAAQHRARIFISSRPYAWRPESDRNLIEQLLPFKMPSRGSTGVSEGCFEGSGASGSAEQVCAFRVYVLDPLEETDVRKFAEHRKVPDVDRLLDELQRANLMPLAERPFDLESILTKWKTDRALGGRLELLRHNIDLRLNEIDPDRQQRQPLSPEKARRGARLLAASVILTGKSGIHVPDSTHSRDGIDAQTVLGDWNPKEVQALLEHGIFNDVLYGIVRFRHREVRELLAAEWFRDQLRNGSSRRETESLFLREQYGHAVITPRLRPVLYWLILFDDEIRRKALEISPKIAVEGGDAAHLPLAIRQELLQDIVRRIAKGVDDGSARDNAAIARIAQLDLAGEALRLINEHRDNDEAISFLGRLVWQGEMTVCVPDLSEVAGDPSRGVYARIAATRAVMTCGNRDQRHLFWSQLAAAAEVLPFSLLAEIVEHAVPDMVSIDLLLDSLGNSEAYRPDAVTELRSALHGFIDRLPAHDANCKPNPLAKFVSGLNDYLGRKPYHERDSQIGEPESRLSAEFAWLLAPATHAVERLVSARATAALSSDSLAIMLMQAPIAQILQVNDSREDRARLHEHVPVWHELNDALFWRSVEDERHSFEGENQGKLLSLWLVQGMFRYWNFGTERFLDVIGFIGTRDHLGDQLVALSLAHQLFVSADRPDGWLNELDQATAGSSALKRRLGTLLNARKSQEQVEWEEDLARIEQEVARQRGERTEEEKELNRSRAEWVKHLKATPEIVRHPPGLRTGALSSHQFMLMLETERSACRSNRGKGTDWKALVPNFGNEVASAYREAAMAHWRKVAPDLRSERPYPRFTRTSLEFGMAGLKIEAREVEGFPANLTEEEAQHALRYVLWETARIAALA